MEFVEGDLVLIEGHALAQIIAISEDMTVAMVSIDYANEGYIDWIDVDNLELVEED